MKVKAICDANFVAKFGSDTNNAVRRVVAHAQHVYKWPSLKTKIIFDVSPGVQTIEEKLTAGEDM